MTARAIANLDLLHHGYHPPQPSHPDYDRELQVWTTRYLARLDAAERMHAAIAAIEGTAQPRGETIAA